MPELEKDYTFAGRHSFGFFRHVDFYYSPVRSVCWAIQVKGEVKYFSSLKGCLDYARMNVGIKDKNLPAILKNLQEHERLEDGRWFRGRNETPEKHMSIFRETR